MTVTIKKIQFADSKEAHGNILGRVGRFQFVAKQMVF
jgi:hypothetical protein